MRISGVIPDRYREHLLPGAAATFTQLRNGEVCSQCKTEGGLAFWQHHICMYRDDFVYPFTPDIVALFHFMMEGEVDLWLNDAGPVHLYKSMFGLFLIPPELTQKVFLKAGEYVSCHFDFNIEKLAHLTYDFPELQQVVDAVQRADPRAGYFTQGLVDFSIRGILKAIMTYHFREDSRELYYFLEGRLNDLILQYMQQVSGMLRQGIDISRKEIKLVMGLKIYLIERLGKNFDLEAYARSHDVSGSTLRRLFKRCFDQTPQDFFLSALMERAKYMVQYTERSISRIALHSGYSSVSSFIKAFKSRFGHAPSFYRK